jgi:anti-anti-sigma factor
MHVHIERHHHYAVVRPEGRFFGGGATAELERKLGAVLDDGVPVVAVDLGHVEHLNSVAIGILVAASRRAATRGTAFALCGADRSIRHMLVILRLVNFVPVFDRLEVALAAIAPRQSVPAGAKPGPSPDGAAAAA